MTWLGEFDADSRPAKGLAAGLFYHPGFAKYMEYEKGKTDNIITTVDVVSYILTQFATVEDVKNGMQNVRVVAVVEEALSISVFAHWMVNEASGKSIVIEYL